MSEYNQDKKVSTTLFISFPKQWSDLQRDNKERGVGEGSTMMSDTANL